MGAACRRGHQLTRRRQRRVSASLPILEGDALEGVEHGRIIRTKFGYSGNVVHHLGCECDRSRIW
jgi:hypothetical protein